MLFKHRVFCNHLMGAKNSFENKQINEMIKEKNKN